MSRRTIEMTEALHQYLLDAACEPPVLARLRAETAKLPSAGMQISPEQGRLMALLVELVGARRCLEVGVFTGYSSTVVALALPPDGKLVACDRSEEWTAIARRYWEEAGVASKIELRLGDAVQTLDELASGEKGSFDFAFIDADKTSYRDYYERLLRLIRPGGLIAVDNTIALAGGPIFSERSESAEALLELNAFLRDDERVDHAMLSIGEGLTLLRKR